MANPYAIYNKYHKGQSRQWVGIEVFALNFLFQPKGGKSKATEPRSVSPCLFVLLTWILNMILDMQE